MYQKVSTTKPSWQPHNTSTVVENKTVHKFPSQNPTQVGGFEGQTSLNTETILEDASMFFDRIMPSLQEDNPATNNRKNESLDQPPTVQKAEMESDLEDKEDKNLEINPKLDIAEKLSLESSKSPEIAQGNGLKGNSGTTGEGSQVSTPPIVQPNPQGKVQRLCTECEQEQEEDNNKDENLSRMGLQAKLTIGEPGDKYEQEADQVARQVVQRINSPQIDVQESETVQKRSDLMAKVIQRIHESRQEEKATPQVNNNFVMRAYREVVGDSIPNVQADFEDPVEMGSGVFVSFDRETNRVRFSGEGFPEYLRQSQGFVPEGGVIAISRLTESVRSDVERTLGFSIVSGESREIAEEVSSERIEVTTTNAREQLQSAQRQLEDVIANYGEYIPQLFEEADRELELFVETCVQATGRFASLLDEEIGEQLSEFQNSHLVTNVLLSGASAAVGLIPVAGPLCSFFVSFLSGDVMAHYTSQQARRAHRSLSALSAISQSNQAAMLRYLFSEQRSCVDDVSHLEGEIEGMFAEDQGLINHQLQVISRLLGSELTDETLELVTEELETTRRTLETYERIRLELQQVVSSLPNRRRRIPQLTSDAIERVRRGYRLWRLGYRGRFVGFTGESFINGTRTEEEEIWEGISISGGCHAVSEDVLEFYNGSTFGELEDIGFSILLRTGDFTVRGGGRGESETIDWREAPSPRSARRREAPPPRSARSRGASLSFSALSSSGLPRRGEPGIISRLSELDRTEIEIIERAILDIFRQVTVRSIDQVQVYSISFSTSILRVGTFGIESR